MYHRRMPDRYVVPDLCRVRPVHDVHDRTVLDVAAATDADPVHVAAHDGVHPYAGFRADLNVADHLSTRIDIGAFLYSRHAAAIRTEHSPILALSRTAKLRLWHTSCTTPISAATRFWVVRR